MLPQEEAWRIAREHGTSDPERLAREMGVKVIYAAMSRVYGLAVSLGRRKIIIVKADLPERARKFVVAHELGHFVLHPEGGFFLILTKTLFYGKWEYEANLFALALLLGEKYARHERLLAEMAAGRADKFFRILE